MSPRRSPDAETQGTEMMSGHKVLKTTTRTHGMAITMYLMVVVLGLLHVTDSTAHTGMDGWIGVANTHVWALWHIPAGISALVGALVAAGSKDPRTGTWVELVGCSSIAAIEGLYLYSLFRIAPDGPFTGAVTTQAMTLGLMTGALISVVQIAWDQRKVRKAWEQGGRPASESVLAEPTASDGPETT